MYKILILNGPNLNLLGKREPDIYGNATLDAIMKQARSYAEKHDISVETFQSNHEGALIDMIHENADVDGIIINPAAYTHTSIALYDALKAVDLPVVEVHLSNIFAREDFRKKSVTGKAAVGSISGFGDFSYVLAIDAIKHYLDTRHDNNK